MQPSSNLDKLLAEKKKKNKKKKNKKNKKNKNKKNKQASREEPTVEGGAIAALRQAVERRGSLGMLHACYLCQQTLGASRSSAV